MKRFLQFSGLIAIAVGMVGLMLIMFTHSVVGASEPAANWYSGVSAIFGGGTYKWTISGWGISVSDVAAFTGRNSSSALFAWIFALVALLALVAGVVLPMLKIKAFDRFAAAASKNNFDVCSYMKFCVQVCGIDESSIGKSILSSAVLSRYAEHMKERLRLRHIYKWFMKSVKFIAETCVEEDYFTAKDYLRMLIDTHQIGACIMSGKISLYFFAAIPNFNRAISHLDYFSRLELVPLAEHFDIYHSDVNKAYMQIRNVKVNPVD